MIIYFFLFKRKARRANFDRATFIHLLVLISQVEMYIKGLTMGDEGRNRATEERATFSIRASPFPKRLKSESISSTPPAPPSLEIIYFVRVTREELRKRKGDIRGASD